MDIASSEHLSFHTPMHVDSNIQRFHLCKNSAAATVLCPIEATDWKCRGLLVYLTIPLSSSASLLASWYQTKMHFEVFLRFFLLWAWRAREDSSCCILFFPGSTSYIPLIKCFTDVLYSLHYSLLCSIFQERLFQKLNVLVTRRFPLVLFMAP